MTTDNLPNGTDKFFASIGDSRIKNNTNFSLSENTKSLGILRIAREHNTIVVEIKNGQSNDDPFVIRRAIDFKDWNNFVQGLKINVSNDLQFEFERKQLNRIIANVETVLNKNYEAIKTPAEASAAANNNIKSQLNLNYPEKSDGSSSSNDQNKTGINNLKKDNADSEKPIPFLTINQLVKK